MSRDNRINNSELVFEIEEMIKKYNKKPEKKIRKRDIVRLLQDAELIVAVRTNFDEAEIFGEAIDGVSFRPDAVKDGKRARLLPVFTSYSQIPQDYMETFSLIKIPAAYAYSYMNQCDDLNGMVVNPFTEANLELTKRQRTNTNSSATKNYAAATPQTKRSAMVIYNNKKYEINKTPFIIGRSNANITIPETYISKVHAVISFKDGKYRIADYESTNGTKVNGTELRSKVYYELQDGYVIELSEKEKLVVYIN